MKNQTFMEHPATTSIEENMVVEFIQANPEFFQRHPDLLAHLRMPNQNNGTISLVERQTQVLREKVSALQEEITELMVVARQNEKIYQVFVELYVQLLECETISDVENTLANIFSHELQMTSTKLKVFSEQKDNTFLLPRLGQKALMENRLSKQSFYMGRLNQTESSWLFEDSHNIASVALIKIGDDLALLAVASDKEEHFQPQMDTLFIGQLQRLLGLILPKILSSR